MKKLLKIASIICALLLSISVFVGCGEKYNLGGFENLKTDKYYTSSEITEILEARDILDYGLVSDLKGCSGDYGYRLYKSDEGNTYVYVQTQSYSQASETDQGNWEKENYEKSNGSFASVVRDDKLKISNKEIIVSFDFSSEHTKSIATNKYGTVILYECSANVSNEFKQALERYYNGHTLYEKSKDIKTE